MRRLGEVVVDVSRLGGRRADRGVRLERREAEPVREGPTLQIGERQDDERDERGRIFQRLARDDASPELASRFVLHRDSIERLEPLERVDVTQRAGHAHAAGRAGVAGRRRPRLERAPVQLRGGGNIRVRGARELRVHGHGVLAQAEGVQLTARELGPERRVHGALPGLEPQHLRGGRADVGRGARVRHRAERRLAGARRARSGSEHTDASSWKARVLRKSDLEEFAGDELADSSRRERNKRYLAAGSPGTVESRGRTRDALDARTAAFPMGSTVSTPTPRDPEGASATPRPASPGGKNPPLSAARPYAFVDAPSRLSTRADSTTRAQSRLPASPLPPSRG